MSDARLIDLAASLRSYTDASVDNCSYVSKVVTTGKGNR
jgi:hypothetical protein